MTWRPWRKRVEESQEAVRAAERLRDTAQAQQRQAERIAPRVAAVSASLQRLRADGLEPTLDVVLRGGEVTYRRS